MSLVLIYQFNCNELQRAVSYNFAFLQCGIIFDTTAACACLQVRGLLIRHPEHFYVSRKGARDTVFLREAYEGIHVPGQRQQYLLKDKHPLVDLKEKYFSLMEVKPVPSRQSTDSVPIEESSTFQDENELSNASSTSVFAELHRV